MPAGKVSEVIPFGPRMLREPAKPLQDMELRYPDETDSFARAVRQLTLKLLQDHGNEISRQHRTLLFDLATLMTWMADGVELGRYAFDMPTGGGKTTAAVAFAKTMMEKGPSKWSMAICASRLEELEEVYRQLVAGPVRIPEEEIGFWHSQGSKADLPATFKPGEEHRYADRRILLFTHSRLQRAGKNASRNLQYKGHPRNLLVHDESLVTRGQHIYDYSRLTGQLEELIAYVGRQTKEAHQLQALKDRLDAEVEAQKSSGNTPTAIRYSPWEEDRLAELEHLAEEKLDDLPGHYQQAAKYLRHATSDARVLRLPSGGADDTVIHTFPSVPDDLTRMIVLDASYPIRTLLKLANDNIAAPYKRLALTAVDTQWPKVPTRFKRYDHLTIHLMKTPGSGRNYIRNDLSEEYGNSEVDREVARVVAEDVPADKAVLIWTFKQRDGDPDFRDRILKRLQEAGTDVDARVLVGDEWKPRITVETFGRETASNAFKHCEYVIFAGGLEKPLTGLAADYLAEVRDIEREIKAADLEAIRRGEVWHSVLQAMSRGAMRDVWVDQEGRSQAKPMHVYLFSRHNQVEDELGSVLPGARWVPWVPRLIGKTVKTREDELIDLIVAELEGMPDDVPKISSQKMKDRLGQHLGSKPSEGTYKRARTKALENIPWSIQGRSFIREF